MKDVFPTWTKDDEFKALPGDHKERILSNYFDKNISDDEFVALDPGRQKKIRGRFVDKGLSFAEVEETPILPAVGRAIATIPPHIVRAGLGLAQKGAERWEGEREEVRGALETVRGVEPPRVKKEIKPLITDEDIGTLLLDLAGKGVERVGEGVRAITETRVAKAYKGFRAKSRIAEAMVGGELRPEVMQLIKKGDKESLAIAAKMLETEEGFFQSWVGKKAEEHIAKPIAEAAAKGGKWLGKMTEKIRPTTRRGSYKYYVTSAIEGVGSTMGPALAVSIATKNPGLGMAIMFPQVFGEVYSETRASGKGVLESTQKGLVYAGTEVLSEGIPLGILTKVGGKLTTRIFKSASAEGFQEVINEAAQIAYDEGIIDEHTPHHEIGRRLLDSGIIGAIGGGGMAVGAHAFTGTEEKATTKLKKDVLDGITETYDKGELDVGRTVASVMEGYKSGLFDDTDLGELSKKYPELKKGIETAKVGVKIGVVRDTLINSIMRGLETGYLEGKPFTKDHAINFIRNGFENDIFTKEDIEGFKERHPALKGELNALIVEDVAADLEFDEFEFEPVADTVTEKPEIDYAVQDIENIYLKAKERVRIEPTTLQEIQERFKERQGREASTRENEELKRIYEKAKRRSQKKAIFERGRKKPEAPPKTKEELELEAYEPALPPGQVEVRVKEGERTYPRGAKFVAGKPAPEELKVEYKPVLKKVGKKNVPWLTLSGARNALESDKMREGGVSPATHKVVAVEGGYQITKIKAPGLALARKVKKEVKGKTLLSWVRAMGGVKDQTLPGEVRALTGKETGVVGLTAKMAEKGLGFDEMASAAVEHGWLPENLEDRQGAFVELLRGDIAAQKEGKPRAERLADVAARTEREERWKEFDRAEDDMLKYFAEHPSEEVLADLDKWQRDAADDIRSRDEKRAEEIEESTRREVEAENSEMERLEGDEGFSEYIEGWDEKEALDDETVAELEAWRAEQKEGVDEKAQEAATSPESPEPMPTEKQIEAGNYKKGHVEIQGLDISIENPMGSKRTGTDLSGKEWSVTMKHHYGYIKGTVGKDKEHLDVFVGNKPESNLVFIVDQVDPETRTFDEHKIIVGTGSVNEARKTYLDNYEKGWKGLGSITEIEMGVFKEWIKSGDTQKSFNLPEKKKVEPIEPETVEPIVTKEKTVVFGESPHKGWIIFNAPRSMKGHTEWQAEGGNGRFFAAIDPEKSNAKTFAQYNMLYGGVQVEYIKEPTIEEALEWWKSGGNKIPTKKKRLDRILTNYKNYLYEQKITDKKEAISHIELVKRYVEETGKKVEKGELDKVKEKYPEEWAKIEKAEAHKKELWDKLPESFRRNRGINEYTIEELGAMVAEEQTWEMTLNEIHAVRDSLAPQVQKAEEKLKKLESRPTSKDPAISMKHIEQVNAQKKLLEDLIEKKEKYLLATGSHKSAIVKAQGRGEKIPRKVLAEYPELAEPIKEPWETSDLAIRPNIPDSYIQAKKQADGKYRLFFTGTRNEVFEGETFSRAAEARSFFKAQRVKARRAIPAKKISKGKGARVKEEGTEYYEPFTYRTRNKVIEAKESFAGIRKQYYADGFFTDGFYAVKLPKKPDTKYPVMTGKEAVDVKGAIPTEGLVAAKIAGEFKVKESDVPLAHIVDSNGREVACNANFVDVILTKYSDAQPFVAVNNAVVFQVKGKTVGFIMPLDIRGDIIPESLREKIEEPEVKFSVAAPMYSALTRAAEAPKFPANIPARSVINQLKKAPGVKQAEIEVSGLAEWLEGKDRVSKADVVKFLRMTEVRVEDVEKGVATPEQIEVRTDILFEEAVRERMDEIEEETGEISDYADVSNMMDYQAYYETAEKEIEEQTKFAEPEYRLPGGDPGSYRELVLRVPVQREVGYVPPLKEWVQTQPWFATWISQGENQVEAQRLYDQWVERELKGMDKTSYISPHWPDDPNVIAHIRGDVRTGPDGKRLFHVAEFQSDIYSRIVELEADVASEVTSEWRLVFPDGIMFGVSYTSRESAQVEADHLNGDKKPADRITVKEIDKAKDVKTELANLKKLFPWGEMWHELVAKKALEYAVKNNLDGISWDTGKTQVDRWESALRKSVDKIDWSKGWRDGEDAHISGVKDGGQVFMEQVPLQGETAIGGQRVTLNNLIGKELAAKIRESSENSGTFKGKNLTIGGEFYKILYDQRIPGFLKKYGKKWGAKVEEQDIAIEKPKKPVTDIDAALEEYWEQKRPIITRKVHTMSITPDMRQAIQTSGQALFAEGAAPGKKLTVDTAKAEIAERIGKKAVDALEKSKKVIFISRDEVADIIGYTRESMDQGFYKDGITYLISENIDKGKAWGVLMHELGVHLGYNKIFGEKLAKEVFAAFVAENGKQTKLGKAVSRAMVRVRAAKVTRPDLINEEAVAYFAEENANIDLPLHRKIIARMRLWAVKYFGIKPDIFVHDDYVALAVSSMRGEIRETTRAPVREGISREVFYSEINKFSVPEMPVKEAAKKVTDNPNFVEWFGDSKAQGIWYHASPYEFTEFKGYGPDDHFGFHFGTEGAAREAVSKKGGLSIDYDIEKNTDDNTWGIWRDSEWVADYKTKKEAQETISGMPEERPMYEVYLSIQNPIKMSDLGTWHPMEISRTLQDKKYITEKEYEQIFKAYSQGQELANILLEKGYDGIKYINEVEDIGSVSFVALKPTQIKSIFNVGTFDPTKADIRYSVAEQKDLQAWADDLIKSAKEEGPIINTKDTVVTDDYISNRKINRNIKLKAKSNIKYVASEISEGVDKFLGSISTRLGQVSPKLKAKMRRLDFDTNTKYADDVKAVQPLLLKTKKMSKDDFADWDYARKNSDIAKINELIVKYDMQKEYDAYREILARLRMEAIDVGLDIGEIEEYAPRILKDSSGFLTAIGRGTEWPIYSRRLQERADELGISVAKMTPDMKADIVSNMILGGWGGLSGIPSTKQRKLKKIPCELNQYYMDSDAALMQHLYSMRKGIEARKFFGKIPKKVSEMRTRLYATQAKIREINKLLNAKPTEEEIAKLKKRRNQHIGLEKKYTAYIAQYATQRDYTENIGTYVMELITNKEISPEHERVVNEILNARFHEVGTRGLIQAYKNLSYIDTMGSPISALTQIGDLAWAGYEGGIIRALKYAYRSATGKSRITKEDVGVTRIAQEFADPGTLGRAVTTVFKIVGLEKIDTIGKEALLNTALEKYQKQARVDPEELKKKIETIFEFETDSVIEDLVNNEISENVKLLVYSRLLDFQPVGLSEMPQKYLDAGNGRLFYMLKTFTIKVFDVFRNEAYYKIKKGDREEKIQGMKNLARLAFFFVLANAGADELKDWVLGRKTEFSDRMIDNALRLFGVSKFVTWKARTEGVGSALARQVLPPFKFIDSAGKDILTAGDEKGLEVLGSVPVIGKLAYWHIGRGVSKREDLWDRRLRKRKAKLSRIHEDFEKAEDKEAFRRKHWEELGEFQAAKNLQSKLNRRRKKINKIKSEKEKETPIKKKMIQKLENERTDLIRAFLKKETTVSGDSIWSALLGTTAEPDATQIEVSRLVNIDILKRSGKPSRNINAGYGIEVELNDDQYTRYIANTSTLIKKGVDRLTKLPKWSRLSDKKKAFAIKRVIKEGRGIVRDRLKKTILRSRLKTK